MLASTNYSSIYLLSIVSLNSIYIANNIATDHELGRYLLSTYIHTATHIRDQHFCGLLHAKARIEWYSIMIHS